MDPNLAAKIGPYLLPGLVVALVTWRLVRNAPQKVKLKRIFLRPSLIALVAGLTLAQSRLPSLTWIAVYTVAAAAGAGVGYLTVRHREFALDAETGEITSRATPLGTAIFAGLFALRFGLKFLFPDLNGASPYGASIGQGHVGTLIGWTEAGLLFSAAMLAGSAVTTWVRTRPLVTGRTAEGT